ncbi:MAG TPA: glycosyltransferase family 39 protein, partial [Thermomicrobiales bacterium]|nr:glycosyltransferase family 39 protein [Thermomicrobiales bacterium]
MTASDAAEQHEPVAPTPPAAVPPRLPDIEDIGGKEDEAFDPVRGGLDRRIEIGASGWYGLLTVLGLLIAFGMRFSQLNIYSMAQGEAQWAYDSWALYLGKQLPNGADLPTTSPLFLLLQSLSYFLFGVTDAIARIVPAIFGLLLVVLILLLRPFLSRFAIVGMILLAAVSPTLVYTSRTSEPDILVGFCSFLFFVALLRAGAEGTKLTTTWMAVAGFAFAGTLASGPDGVTALIAVLIGLGVAVVTDSSSASKTQGAVAASIRTVIANRRALASGVAAAIVTIFVLFTRGFSDATALSGLGTTFSDWGKMMTTQSSNTPIPFFFYTTLLYEILAVVFAIVAVTAGRSKDVESDSRHDLNATAFVTWFVVALLLESFASGKQPDQLSIVTLPLVLLGGVGLGYMLERIPWSRMLNSTAGVVPIALAGILIGVIAALTLVARSNDPAQQNESFLDIAMPIVFVLVIVVAPLIFLLAGETASRRQISHLGWSALLVVAVLLGLYTIGSSTSLSFSRADTGLEPAAQGTSTSGLKAFVNQTLRLSRDMTDGNVSNIDNTGSYG